MTFEFWFCHSVEAILVLVTFSERTYLNSGCSIRTMPGEGCVNSNSVTPLEQRYFISIRNSLSEQTCHIRTAVSG
jgi:hypothetical protein